jgi:hypothetical protein
VTARLTAAVEASALMRRVAQLGGFAAVIAKGDEVAGNILIQCAEKGSFTGLYERMLQGGGHYQWQRVGPQDHGDEQAQTDYILRRRANDPDLWLIELDIPNAERLIAEMTSET